MAFPTNNTVIDSATRADGAIGSNWTADFAGLGDDTPVIESNLIRTPSGGAGWSDAFWNVANFGPDFEIYAEIVTKPANTEILGLHGGVLSAGTSGADGYSVYLKPVAGTDTITLERFTNGVWSGALVTALSQEFTNGWWIGLDRIGTTISSWYFNGSAWVQAGTTTDATHTGTGRIAFDMQGTTSRIRNITGGTVVVAGGTIDQLTHQWREDDGSESGASSIGSPGGNLVRPVASAVRARIQLQATGDPVAIVPLFEYRIKRASKADPWRTVRR